MSSDFKVNLHQDFYARRTVPETERKYLYQQRQELKKELLNLQKNLQLKQTPLIRATHRLDELTIQTKGRQLRIEFLQKFIKDLDQKIDFATCHPANKLPIVPKSKLSCDFIKGLGSKFGKFLKFIK